MNDTDKTPKAPLITDRLISLIKKMSEEQQEALLKKLEERLSKERRQHPRKPVSAFVDLVFEGRSYREFTRNISEGGVHIETSIPFSVGRQIMMTFTFPGSSNHLKISGRVLRVEDSGIAVRFDVNSMVEALSIESLLKKI